jgi:hypothetical protein
VVDDNPLAETPTVIGVRELPVTGILKADDVAVPFMVIAVPLAAVAATSTEVVPKGTVTL